MFNTKNILNFLSKHAHFQNKFKTIHVGGTNGKGSVSHMIEAILSEEGYRVGLYTSPYEINRFDNIKINRVPIKDDDIKALFKAYEKDFEYFHLSEFEIDTVIAFKYFYDQHVDIAVIEVGLGGIDDATNVINPLVSIITNIGTDHQDVLGHSKKEIALKKAGIIKPQTPIVVGYGIEKDLEMLFSSIAQSKDAPFHLSSKAKDLKIKDDALTFTYDNQSLTLKTQAIYQAPNALVAIKAIEVLKEHGIIVNKKAIMSGLKYPLPSKRFQWLSKDPLVLMDGAHNKEGILALINAIKALDFNGPIQIICSILKDKPHNDMLEALKEISTDITLTTFDHPRAIDLNDIRMKDIKLNSDYQSLISSISNTKKSLTLITGSLYFLSKVDQYLKENPL